MAGGQIHLYIDPNVHTEFINIVGKGNQTKVIYEYIMNVIATHNQDVTKINMKLVNQKIDMLNKDISKLKAELSYHLEMKDRIEKENMINEEKKLIKEKEKIESMQNCVNCGNMLHLKKHQTNQPDKWLCPTCYSTLSKDDVKKYLG